jgi:peptidoglycan hydrolase-like protein with peptidoglycan-binding domain
VSAPAGASSLLQTLTTYSGMQLQRGDSGPVVRAVQQAVGAGVDGSFGPLTQAAVTSWQRAHEVSATGVVDGATWHALLKAGAPKAPAPVPTPKPRVAHPELTRYKSQTLHVGSHGAAVAAVQVRLDMNPHRGNFGAKTRARVQRFQRNHHVRATGNVGPATWKALGA